MSIDISFPIMKITNEGITISEQLLLFIITIYYLLLVFAVVHS